MEELWNQTPKDIFDTNTVSSVSDQLEQDYRRYVFGMVKNQYFQES